MDAEKKKKPGWTEERVEVLTRLWKEGLSAAEIARELGGVTRNAVIGKIHRLRLSGRAPAHGTAPRKKPAAPKAKAQAPSRPVSRGATALKAREEAAPAPAPKAKPAVAALVETPQKGRITNIMELTRSTCRWPIGDPGEEGFAYCGCQASTGSPYCEAHARMAYQQPPERRKRA